jgi:hypothetical protein
MIDKKYQPVAFAFALIGALATGLSAGTAAAASAEEMKICKETISEMTGGKFHQWDCHYKGNQLFQLL